jgi:hypothetical protein
MLKSMVTKLKYSGAHNNYYISFDYKLEKVECSSFKFA